MGIIKIPPMMKPFLEVASSLAPKEIWIILCKERFTVTITTIQLKIPFKPTPAMGSNQGTFCGKAKVMFCKPPKLLVCVKVASVIPP